MKIGKILMLAIVISSLLAISTSSVVAVDENELITDGIGDVENPIVVRVRGVRASER